jgi:uncharacterized phiE125 gp8 family phage protein
MIKQSTNIYAAAGSSSVTTANAKAHLKVEHSADDTLIDGYVLAAQSEVETFTNRVLISTTFDLYLTDFPKNGIVLPFSPVSAITSIKYYDGSNVQQTWAASNYHYNIYEEPCVIRYVDSAPDVYEDRSDAVIIRFTAGYANAAAIPAPLVQAVKLLMADLYENRTDVPREAFTAWMRRAYPYRIFHEPEENQ